MELEETVQTTLRTARQRVWAVVVVGVIRVGMEEMEEMEGITVAVVAAVEPLSIALETVEVGVTEEWASVSWSRSSEVPMLTQELLDLILSLGRKKRQWDLIKIEMAHSTESVLDTATARTRIVDTRKLNVYTDLQELQRQLTEAAAMLAESVDIGVPPL